MTTVTIQQNVGGYTGTKDTYIRESRPTNSYGSAAAVFADGSDISGAEIQGLLSFSNIFGDGPGKIPLGSTITSATLTLTMSDGTSSPISFYRMAQNWTGLATWNSWGNGIQTNGIEALSTADLTLAGLGPGAQSIDVMQSLQAWSNGATNFGWMLSSGGTDGFSFSSASGTSAPVLTVTYEAPIPPEPGLTVIETGGTTVVAEGGAGDMLLIALRSAPTSDVTITITTTGTSDLNIVQTVLTFTAANWQTQQTVALSAINDRRIEGTETFTVTMTATSADATYDGLSSNVAVGVTDNDELPTVLSPAVVAIHDTTLYTAGDASSRPGCGDPSGIAYVPGLNQLYIVDSEHDETPYNSQTNLFVTTLDGTHLGSFSMRAFTREPTGIAYNKFNGLLYISDDDARRIFVIDPTNPTVLISSINLAPYGINDAEDPEIDPVTGHIFLLDGSARKLVELTETGAFISATTLPSAILDAEALAYDPIRDVFYIGSGATRGTIFQTDREGHILATINLLNTYTHPETGSKPKIKGMELAPSSNPNDGDRMSLYVCDYGSDQVMDGRVFEVDLYYGWLGA